MGALLAIATFALFILIDYLLTRHAAVREGVTEAALGVQAAAVPAPALVKTEPRPEPVWVAGFDMPEQLHYHRGHIWARVVGPDTAAVGVDDFGRRLLGTAQGVELPKVGSYIRQGGKGAQIDVARPRRGPRLAGGRRGRRGQPRPRQRDPHLLSDDPYGRGWLCKVRSTDLAANLRNLLYGSPRPPVDRGHPRAARA